MSEKSEDTKSEGSCRCLCCPRNKTLDKEIKKKDMEESSIMTNITLNSYKQDRVDYNLDEKKYNMEDYYFGRPEENKYTNEKLYNMEIQEIIFGIHPTFYGEKLEEKSFHPFFYLNLFNDEIEGFGVVIHYIYVPKSVKNEQLHLYEENGIEFIEKQYEEFETELKLIFNRAIQIPLVSLSKWIISYKPVEFGQMNLRQFFQKTIPVKGEYNQDFLKNLQKTCFDFCINSISRLNLKKKKAKAINEIKTNMESVLNNTKDSKHYKKYVDAFNKLFTTISE